MKWHVRCCLPLSFLPPHPFFSFMFSSFFNSGPLLSTFEIRDAKVVPRSKVPFDRLFPPVAFLALFSSSVGSLSLDALVQLRPFRRSIVGTAYLHNFALVIATLSTASRPPGGGFVPHATAKSFCATRPCFHYRSLHLNSSLLFQPLGTPESAQDP